MRNFADSIAYQSTSLAIAFGGDIGKGHPDEGVILVRGHLTVLLPENVTMAIRSPLRVSSRSRIAILDRSRRLGRMSSASMEREVSSKIQISRPWRFIFSACGFHLGWVKAMTMLIKLKISKAALNTA